MTKNRFKITTKSIIRKVKYDKTNLSERSEAIPRGFSPEGHFAVVHCPSPGYLVLATELQKKDVKI